MKSTSITWALLVGSFFALLPVAHAGSTKSPSVRDVFFPYQEGTPPQPGIRPGLTIDQHNWQVAEPVLPAEILQLIQAGEFRISVQETMDLPPRAPLYQSDGRALFGRFPQWRGQAAAVPGRAALSCA